jgi:hypothetical protein
MKIGQKRAERRAAKTLAKETRQATRQSSRMARKELRKSTRLEKLAIKTPGRDARRLAIAELATAPIAEGLGAGIGAIGEGFGTKLAGPGGMPARDEQGNERLSQKELMPEVDPNAQREGDTTKKPNIMIIAVIAIVAIMMFKKKGKK